MYWRKRSVLAYLDLIFRLSWHPFFIVWANSCLSHWSWSEPTISSKTKTQGSKRHSSTWLIWLVLFVLGFTCLGLAANLLCVDRLEIMINAAALAFVVGGSFGVKRMVDNGYSGNQLRQRQRHWSGIVVTAQTSPKYQYRYSQWDADEYILFNHSATTAGFLLLAFSRGRWSENNISMDVGTVLLVYLPLLHFGLVWISLLTGKKLMFWLYGTGCQLEFQYSVYTGSDGLSLMLGVITGVGFLIHMHLDMRGEEGYSLLCLYQLIYRAWSFSTGW